MPKEALHRTVSDTTETSTTPSAPPDGAFMEPSGRNQIATASCTKWVHEFVGDAPYPLAEPTAGGQSCGRRGAPALRLDRADEALDGHLGFLATTLN